MTQSLSPLSNTLCIFKRPVQSPGDPMAQAFKRQSCASYWVWGAMDLVCELMLAVDVGKRTLAMAQHLGQLAAMLQVIRQGV